MPFLLAGSSLHSRYRTPYTRTGACVRWVWGCPFYLTVKSVTVSPTTVNWLLEPPCGGYHTAQKRDHRLYSEVVKTPVETST